MKIFPPIMATGLFWSRSSFAQQALLGRARRRLVSRMALAHLRWGVLRAERTRARHPRLSTLPGRSCVSPDGTLIDTELADIFATGPRYRT